MGTIKRSTAIITARGGSKGVPGKNIRLFCGKPLIAYTIEAALQCSLIDNCFVTTDDPKIKDVSRNFGAEVIDRPPELSTDISKSSDAVRHALLQIKKMTGLPVVFTLLQPTSPLRNSLHIEKCLKKWFQSPKYLSAVSVTKVEHHPWKMIIDDDEGVVPVRDAASLEKPRQELPKAYRLNGAIYVVESKIFLEKNTFFINPVMPFRMSEEYSQDIDTEKDFMVCETIMRKILKERKSKEYVDPER
jgi:N-acylneuraminate cytidylyltransferase/CMP-N,N'-diacetyllegionaminic acid synthase